MRSLYQFQHHFFLRQKARIEEALRTAQATVDNMINRGTAAKD